MSDTAVEAKAPPTLDVIVEKYIQLRDRKAQLKKQFDDSVAQIEQAMTKCEAYIQRHLESIGAESVGTAHGTAYIARKTSASVADKDAFMSYVREQELWSMLDVRANKTAVDEYRAEHGDNPPGVNYSVMRTVNIRRS